MQSARGILPAVFVEVPMNSNILNPERSIRQLSSGDRVVHISYGSFLPGDYEKQVILGNKCSALIPMRCIFDGDSADIFYIISGLCGFEEYVEKETDGARSLLEMILNVMKAVRLCGQYLILEHEVSLRPEHIFFSEANGAARLLYMPGSAPGESLGEAFAELLRTGEQRCRLGLFQKELLEDCRNGLIVCGNDLEQMICAAEESMRRTFGMELPEISGAPAAAEEVSVREYSSEYGGTGGIRRHLREFLNDLVS